MRSSAKITTRDIKNGYDGFYENKFSCDDDWTNESMGHPRRWISFLAEKERGQCLVVGCGVVDLKLLQSSQTNVVGIDISRVALEKTARFGKVILADVTHLPFRFSSFDSICAFDVFEHVPDKIKMMTEINNVLRNEGKLFLSVPIKIGPTKGDERQPYDEPPTFIFLIRLVKTKFNLSVIRGFGGRNPFNRLPYELFPVLSVVFKCFPYLLKDSRYVSLVAAKHTLN